MSIVTSSIKMHRMTDITSEFTNINPCKVHGKPPVIYEKVFGRRKEVIYTAECSMKEEDEACGKCAHEKENIVEVWNKYNPIANGK